MEGDHRLEALLAKIGEDVAVVADLAYVELALRGFDARPLNREPMGVLAELPEEGKIFAVAVIVVVGHP